MHLFLASLFCSSGPHVCFYANTIPFGHRRKVGEHSENLNKEIKSIRKQQADFTELKNTTTELKKYTRTLRQQMK